MDGLFIRGLQRLDCPKCQSENPDERKFCRECGVKLLKVCPQCGSENLPRDKFCGECGHDLGKPKEAPPIDYAEPQSYTPKFLVDKILTTRRSIEGERKLVSVLFADVANYTSISEKLDPEEIHQIMDGCFSILMDEIHRYEGTINQFTGDGVMALFGAPVAHEDHTQRACHAALSIQKGMGEYGERIKKDYGVDFKMRIGLNSGPVIVGSIGDDLRMDYTAIGDTVNLASRMESMANPGAILVSRATHKIAKDFFEFDPLGRVQVKGKEEPQEVYELTKAGEVKTRIEASVARGLAKFVGRPREMEALREAFDKARSGSGQVVGIVGEAGVGKSRLILELRGMLPKGQYTYLEGRCLHYGGSMAYLPILDILRSYFEIKEGDREFLIKRKMEGKILRLDENLKGVLPPFHELLSLKVKNEAYLKLEPKQKREKTFEAMRNLLVRDSQNKPLLLVVEDVHWIDKTSEEFLDYLIGWLANTQILLILLYRPEYTHSWGSKSFYNKIGVDQLSTRSSAELVQSILGGAEVAPELRRLILSRTGGNPLFVEELTRTLLENGSIERKDQRCVLSRNASDIQVPGTIHGIIAARMDRLEESLKRIMLVASVIGREFAYPILQAVTGMGEELKSYLLDLQGLEFIYEKSLFPELEYIFKHTLTQEVAYDSLLLKKKKVIHEKIGGAIEHIYPKRVEEFYEVLAYHYAKSENAEKAYQYQRLCGNKAARNHSVWEAFRYYKEAIKVLKKGPEIVENKKERIEVIHLMTIPMVLLGYPEDSLRVLQEGLRLSKEVGDGRSLTTFYGTIRNYYIHRGKPLVGIQDSEHCFEEARKTQDIELMASNAFDLCTSYTAAGRFLKTIEVAPRVLDLLEKTKRESEFFSRPINIYSGLCTYYGHSLGHSGNFEEGKVFCDKGLRTAGGIDDLRTLGFVELYYGYFLTTKGDGKSALGHFQNSIKYLEEVKWIFLLGLAWSGLGIAYHYLGEMETARKHIEKGLRIQIDARIEWRLSFHYWYLGATHLDLGDLKSARSFIDEALKLSEKNNEKHIEGTSRTLLGRISGKTDPSQNNKARECILRGIKILEELKLKPLYAQGYLFLGELYVDGGQKEKALQNLKRAEVMFREMKMDYWLAKTQGALEGL